MALLVSIFLGFPGVSLAAQNADFLVNEDQGIVVARFIAKMPSESEKHPADVYEFLRFFGIAQSQEQLIEKKSGRSLYKIFQKNILGEKSEFHELRWQEGDYFIVAGVLNNSAESLTFLKALPQNPWAGRKTANAETEAGICPTCESSKFMRPIDDWVKSAREWVAVDCQADKADGKITGGKILSAVGSCLRGVALSVVDIAKLVYDLLSTQVKFYSDPHYAIAFARVIWEAVKSPGAFLQNLFSMFWQAAKDTYGKFKGCNIDYQTGLVCQLLVDFLVPGGAIVKGIKLTARGAKGAVGAVGAIRAAATAEAKVIAEAAPKAAARAVDEVALTVRTTSEGLEYTATAGGKEAARVTSDEVGRHLDEMAPPSMTVLVSEVEEIGKIKAEISPGLSQLALTGARRTEIEKLYKKILNEKPDLLSSTEVAANAKTLDRLARLIVEELKAKGIRAKAIVPEGWKPVGNPTALQDMIQKSEALIASATRNMEGVAKDSLAYRNFHKQRLLEQSKLKDYRLRLHESEMSKLADLVQIDLKSTPELAAVAEKLKVTEMTIPLRRFQEGDVFSGIFSTADRSVSLGVNSVLNPEGFIDAIARHEFHHAATHAKKLRGESYPFFGQVFSSGGHSINTLEAYSRYFDFDEIPAYSRSVAYAERGLENPAKIAIHEGHVVATVQRKTAVDTVRQRAEQLRHMSLSGLDAIKLARETIARDGMQGIKITTGQGPARMVTIDLKRKGEMIGRLAVDPPAFRAGLDKKIPEVLSEYLDEMEAATRAHLATADRTLAASREELAKRINQLTERSRNARSRRAAPTESAVEVEK